jgi:hypothetical protein
MGSGPLNAEVPASLYSAGVEKSKRLGLACWAAIPEDERDPFSEFWLG